MGWLEYILLAYPSPASFSSCYFQLHRLDLTLALCYFGAKQILNGFASSLPDTDTTTLQSTATMAEQTDIPTGHVGNLTAEQEAKLRDLWTIVFKFLDMYEAETEANPDGTNTQEAAAAPEKEKRGWFGRGSSKPKTTTASSNVTHHKYPNLIKEVMAILPPEDRDNQELVKIAVEALDLYTPDTIRAIIRDCVKHEHPDALALRFLRARKWDLIRAVAMMAKTINWRVNDMKVDAELMKEGEGQAVEDEKTGSGFKKTLSADFLKQIRWGKSYIHGLDRMGRPVNYIRVKLHKASDQCNESIERYTVYLFELGRLALMPPLETAVSFAMAISVYGFVANYLL